MDPTIVYAKTAKGGAEVTTRSGALSPAARRVLIVIDGRRPVGDLAAMVRQGEVELVLNELLTHALIEAVGHAQPTPNATTRMISGSGGGNPLGGQTLAVPGGPAASAETVDPAIQYAKLQDAKRRVIQELHNRLGPDADAICLRVERSKTADEFQERLREAERLIAGLLGQGAAQDFSRALRRKT